MHRNYNKNIYNITEEKHTDRVRSFWSHPVNTSLEFRLFTYHEERPALVLILAACWLLVRRCENNLHQGQVQYCL
jgi:hypothetical protein